MNYNVDCVTKRSMPFWCVSNPLGDPFGGPVLEKIPSVQTARLLAWAAKKGYIEMTAFHDDDLVPWDPEHPEDDLDPKSETYKTLAEIKRILDAAKVEVHTATCSLHGNPIFRNGGLTNPDPKIRELARIKVERCIRIGAFLGAKHWVYWVARDGFEVATATQWDKVYTWLAEGLNHVTDYIEEKGFTNYKTGSVEPKPNEPRGQMFLPTAGHAVGFIQTMLTKKDFWGVNPELLQHESMALLNAVMTVGYLNAMGKLPMIHFGCQAKAQFDNDNPPLVGMEGLKETVSMFWALNQVGWKGVIEYDCHMLRAEGTLADPEKSRKAFIVNCSKALAIALALARRISPVDRASNTKQSERDLATICEMCGLKDKDIQLVR